MVEQKSLSLFTNNDPTPSRTPHHPLVPAAHRLRRNLPASGGDLHPGREDPQRAADQARAGALASVAAHGHGEVLPDVHLAGDAVLVLQCSDGN